eukprot:g3050.t1
MFLDLNIPVDLLAVNSSRSEVNHRIKNPEVLAQRIYELKLLGYEGCAVNFMHIIGGAKNQAIDHQASRKSKKRKRGPTPLGSSISIDVNHAIPPCSESFLESIYQNLQMYSQKTKKTFDSSSVSISRCNYENILPSWKYFQKKRKTQSFSLPVKIYTRLTIHILDTNDQQVLVSKQATLATYDILAISCGTEKVFNFICDKAETVSIVTFDCAERLPFNLKGPMVERALMRGLFIEITYSSALNSRTRKTFLANLASILRVTRGRNVILTSGAWQALFLRSPYDAANLLSLGGCSRTECKQIVTQKPSKVIAKAATCQTVRGIINVEEG